VLIFNLIISYAYERANAAGWLHGAVVAIPLVLSTTIPAGSGPADAGTGTIWWRPNQSWLLLRPAYPDRFRSCCRRADTFGACWYFSVAYPEQLDVEPKPMRGSR
jgi:hypothetical protein